MLIQQILSITLLVNLIKCNTCNCPNFSISIECEKWFKYLQNQLKHNQRIKGSSPHFDISMIKNKVLNDIEANITRVLNSPCNFNEDILYSLRIINIMLCIINLNLEDEKEKYGFNGRSKIYNKTPKMDHLQSSRNYTYESFELPIHKSINHHPESKDYAPTKEYDTVKDLSNDKSNAIPESYNVKDKKKNICIRKVKNSTSFDAPYMSMDRNTYRNEIKREQIKSDFNLSDDELDEFLKCEIEINNMNNQNDVCEDDKLEDVPQKDMEQSYANINNNTYKDDELEEFLQNEKITSLPETNNSNYKFDIPEKYLSTLSTKKSKNNTYGYVSDDDVAKIINNNIFGDSECKNKTTYKQQASRPRKTAEELLQKRTNPNPFDIFENFDIELDCISEEDCDEFEEVKKEQLNPDNKHEYADPFGISNVEENLESIIRLINKPENTIKKSKSRSKKKVTIQESTSRKKDTKVAQSEDTNKNSILKKFYRGMAGLKKVFKKRQDINS